MKATPKKKVAKKAVAKVKAVVARVVKPRVVKGAYTAILEVNGKEYKASGASSIDAMNALAATLTPFMLKTKCFLRLEHKKLTASQMFLAIQLRRFTLGKVARQIWAKRLEARLA